MRGAVSVAMALLVSLGASGCFVSEDDPETQDEETASGTSAGSGTGGNSGSTSMSGTSGSTGSGTGGSDGVPTATLTASALNGSVPLTVNFTLGGSDPEGGALSWVLSFGDNSTDEAGTSLPANVTHDFANAGNFTVVLSVTDADGNKANATVAVAATAGGAAAAIPEDQTFTGTLTGAPGLVLFTANVFVPGSTATHTVTVAGPVSKMTITLSYDDPGGGVVDIDMTITDPSGESTVSNEIGPEPPYDVSDPDAGDWSVEVFLFSGTVENDYTLVFTFE